MKIAEVSFIVVKMRWLKCHFAGDIDIKALRVKCGNLGNGCAWVGELESLDYHHDTCDHTLFACPNECKDGTTLVQVLRKDLATHLKEKCPNRSHKCPHCKRTGKHCDITTSHLKTCAKFEVPCPNKGCGDRLPRCDIPNHYETCSFEAVTCKYSKIGCEQKPLRKELNGHENNDQLHLHIAMEAILQVQDRLSTLEGGGNTTTFKMAEFSQQKKSGKEFISPPFYTHKGGYKMCIRVDANGVDDGQVTHVSVWPFLMRGENDDNLIWPFTGDVTVQLLNQLEDKEHHQFLITFPEDKDDECNRRVVDRDRAPVGWGCYVFNLILALSNLCASNSVVDGKMAASTLDSPNCIPHMVLGHDPDTNCQLLKDDCLYFRVTARAYPKTKPWLTCTT